MHKKLIKLAKQFRYWDYDFAIDIFMYALKMMQFAWENPELALVQNTESKINNYHENLDKMKELQKYYDMHRNGNTVEVRCQGWNNMWKIIQDDLNGWWD